MGGDITVTCGKKGGKGKMWNRSLSVVKALLLGGGSRGRGVGRRGDQLGGGRRASPDLGVGRR